MNIPTTFTELFELIKNKIDSLIITLIGGAVIWTFGYIKGKFKKDILSIFILEDDIRTINFYKEILSYIVKVKFKNRLKLKIKTSMNFLTLDMNDKYDLYLLDWFDNGRCNLDSTYFQDKIYDPEKVIVITGYPDNEDLLQAQDDGWILCYNVLHKGDVKNKLFDVLKNAIEKRSNDKAKAYSY